MQCSAPGLKNAQRRLTIRPSQVPTTETAKPILMQRKPPADPGPAPFKNARFFKFNFFFQLKKKWPSSRKDLLSAPGSVARSRGRRLLFTPARLAPALALAGLPGTFGGAHARSRPCVRRGGAGRACARGRASASRGRGGERAPGRLEERPPQGGRAAGCGLRAASGGSSASRTHGVASPLTACRSAER